MNWKLVIDTFLELYHFRYLHGASVAPLFLDNITTYERRDRHSRFAAAKRPSPEIESQPRETWRLRDHAVVLYTLFPNTVLAYTQDHCGVFTSYPVSPDESLINVSILVDPAVRAKRPESYWKTNQDLILAALDEDFTVGASDPGELPQRRQQGPDLRQVREGAGLVSRRGRRRGRVTGPSMLVTQ